MGHQLSTLMIFIGGILPPKLDTGAHIAVGVSVQVAIALVLLDFDLEIWARFALVPPRRAFHLC